MWRETDESLWREGRNWEETEKRERLAAWEEKDSWLSPIRMRLCVVAEGEISEIIGSWRGDELAGVEFQLRGDTLSHVEISYPQMCRNTENSCYSLKTLSLFCNGIFTPLFFFYLLVQFALLFMWTFYKVLSSATSDTTSRLIQKDHLKHFMSLKGFAMDLYEACFSPWRLYKLFIFIHISKISFVT